MSTCPARAGKPIHSHAGVPICVRYVGAPSLRGFGARVGIAERPRILSSVDPKPRYLALDIGTKRIGIAVSDELGLTAQPVMTLEVRRSRRDDLRSIARLARRFAVAGIVVGNPLHLSGGASPRAAKVQQFAAELGELTGLPIHLWDERFTTHEAHRILYEAGHARQQHKEVVDQVAATLILQSFLDDPRRSDL